MVIKKPTVSVLMSVFNGREYLHTTIKSVLNQSFEDFEFIIVDDCSLDNTIDILTELSEDDSRIRILRNEVNIGLTRSLNIGLSNANGKYIARIDNGDLWMRDKLEKQIYYMINNPETVVVGTQAVYIDDDDMEVGGTKFPINNHSIQLWLISCKNPFLHSAVMFRNKYCYDERYYVAQDLALWTNVFFDGEMANLNDRCVLYRVSKDSITYKKRAMQIFNSYKIYNDFLHMLEKKKGFRVRYDEPSTYLISHSQSQHSKKLFVYLNYLANRVKTNMRQLGVFLTCISYLCYPKLLVVKLRLKYLIYVNFDLIKH